MKRLTILITLLILTACTAAPTPSPSPISTATLTPSPTATLTPTAAGTPTPTEEPGHTPRPTNYPRPTPEPRSPITFSDHENGLPPGAIARLGRGEFLGVDLSSNGQHLGVGTTAGVSVYDARTFEEQWFVSTGDWVNHVDISPDNTMIAGAIRDEVAVWDIHTGDRLHVLGPLDGDIHTISWSPDSSRLFAGSSIGDPYSQLGDRELVPFNTMLVWDIASGDAIFNLHSQNEEELIEGGVLGRSAYVSISLWSHDGRYLVVGVEPSRWLIWWDMESGEQVGTISWEAPTTGHYEFIAKNQVALHPSQNILAASSDGDIVLLDLENGEFIEDLPGMDQELQVVGVSWPQQGNLLLTTSHEVYENTPTEWTNPDTLRIWDLETGKNTGTSIRSDMDTEASGALINDFEWSLSGSEFAAAYKDKQIIIWDAQTGVQRLIIDDPDWVQNYWDGSNLLWFPDDTKLITYTELKIKLWDTVTGQMLNSIETSRFYHAVDWSPDGSTIATGNGSWWLYGHKINWWDAASGQLIQSIPIEDMDIHGPIRAVDYGRVSSRLAVGMGPLNTDRLGAFMILDQNMSNPLAYEASGEAQNMSSGWDTVWDVAWSPDESLVAIATDNRVHLLDGATGELFSTFENVGCTVDWSPDGKHIITWSQEDDQKDVLLIDIESGTPRLLLNIDNRYPTHFEWSPDGMILAIPTGISLAEYGRTYLFDAQSGERLKILSVPEDPDRWYSKPHEHPMTGVAWLDDQTIATSTGAIPHEVFATHYDMGTFGGTVLIWDVQTGEMLLELEGHNGEVQDLALSPDGSTLASASADGTVILWDVAQIMAMIEDR